MDSADRKDSYPLFSRLIKAYDLRVEYVYYRSRGGGGGRLFMRKHRTSRGTRRRKIERGESGV
ncbi:hypothetical protein CDL15_Pgr006899 [Punica granatum]|uniref:Uncharacterized protein n=1 Tax=Punica granatum TaxID=22663 RepID=A0A218X7T1_PUNGR|nr:hypothetical protein CDL15_Pgr006899 [Punica granatum]